MSHHFANREQTKNYSSSSSYKYSLALHISLCCVCLNEYKKYIFIIIRIRFNSYAFSFYHSLCDKEISFSLSSGDYFDNQGMAKYFILESKTKFYGTNIFLHKFELSAFHSSRAASESNNDIMNNRIEIDVLTFMCWLLFKCIQ